MTAETGMVEKRSLEPFFKSRGIDLDACGQERIHHVDALQTGAELIVCAPTPDGWRIVSATQDLAMRSERLGRPVLNAELSTLDGDLASQVDQLTPDVDDQSGLWFLTDSFQITDKHYDAIVHLQGSGAEARLFIELAPSEMVETSELRRGIRAVQRAIVDLGKAETIDAAAQLSVDLLRDLLGYDRVMIYRFMQDWTGEVIAESHATDPQAFKGLRFPSSDIPPQARELLRILPYRMILRTDDVRNPLTHGAGDDAERQPYDLSNSVFRAVSVYHTQYLRNMGVGATMNIGLEKNGKLWGLIACHHDTARHCAYDMISFALEISRAFMACEVRLQDLAKSSKIREMRRAEARFAENIRGTGNILEALKALAPTLVELIPSTGAAIVYGDTITAHGKTPPEDFIRRLVDWTQADQASGTYVTTNLQARWPGAAPFKYTACGVLIQPVLLNRVCQIIWFRQPLGTVVQWAGASEKVVALSKRGDGSPLKPRMSFQAWHEQNFDCSDDWSEAEVSATKEIFTDVLDIVASQARLLATMNDRLSMQESELRRELEQFAAAASHDMRGPLRMIRLAASMVAEDMVPSTTGTHEYLSDIDVASNRLSRLTDRMLEYTRLSQVEASMEVVDLAELLRHIVQSHRMDRAGNPTIIELGQLPAVIGDPTLIETIFENLIGNAIKYHPGNRPVRVTVDSNDRGQECEIRVTDNGDGVDPQYTGTIFEPFKRLHKRDEIEGSGLGLAMCRRIAGILNADIFLDPDHQNGARFTLRIRQVRTRLAKVIR